MTTQTIETAKANVPPVAATDRPAGKVRFLYLDNLRMTVITAVVLMHTAIMYGAEGAWFYHESGEKNILIFVIMMLLGGIGTAFTMGLLFLVAGYFTPRAVRSQGSRAVSDRSVQATGHPAHLLRSRHPATHQLLGRCLCRQGTFVGAIST